MDLEVRSIPAKDRQKYSTRLKSYQTELSRLEKDLVSDTLLELRFKRKKKKTKKEDKNNIWKYFIRWRDVRDEPEVEFLFCNI